MARNRNDMTSKDIDALNAAQVEFSMNPRFFAPQTKHFLQAQEHMLEQVEKFSTAWFKRRHDAAQSMIDVGKRMVSEGQADPATAMEAIVDWQTHSMERLAEDAKDSTELLKSCAGALVENEVEAMEEISDTVKQATKTSKSQPV